MEEEVSAQPPLPVASELPPSPMDDQEQQRKAESLPVDARDRGGADQDEDRNSKEVQATSTSSAQSERVTPKAISTLVDVERIRIKVEVARMRSSGPTGEIPSGRVFDAPLDTASEDAHDAPEKAFAVAAPDTMKRIDEEQRGSENNPADQFAAVKKEPSAFVLPIEKGISSDAPTGLPKKSVAEAGNEKHVKKLENQNHPADAVLKVNSNDDVSEVSVEKKKAPEKEARNGHVPAVEISHTLGGKASVDEKSGSIDEKPAPDVPPSASLAQQETALRNERSDPAVQTKPSTAIVSADSARVPMKKRTAPDENRPLNEYLVSELELFSSCMLGKKDSKEMTKTNRVARASTLQLYHDHTRALVDFDADWKRSHVGAKGWTRQGSAALSVDNARVLSTGLTENPFRNDGTNKPRWVSLLEQVRPSNGDTRQNELQKKGERNNETDLRLLSARGLNGYVVSDKNRDQHRHKIRSLMVEFAQMHFIPGLHIVIASNSELLAWKGVLTSDNQAEVYPYWGEKPDRESILRMLRDKYLSRQKATPHVLLTSYDIFAEDAGVLSMTQWQLAVIEVPATLASQEQLDSVWMDLLSLRVRHRVIVCHQGFHVDARKVLHFLLPGLFSSRRKLLAWNCAAFDADFIRRICDVTKSFALLSNPDEVSAFIANIFQYTVLKSDQELSVLNLLDKNGMLRPSIAAQSKGNQNASESKSPKNQTGAHGKGEEAKRRAVDSIAEGGPQDMKKYGGPGLRKQSCKNRKCINPKSWGMAAKKEKRVKAKKQEKIQDADEDMASEKYESEPEVDDQDDGGLSYYSQESDRESTSGANASHEAVQSDSDAQGFLKSSEDLPLSPREVSLVSSEKLQDDPVDSSLLNGSDAGSKSSRTRVMRCGKCAGCTASDCLKCRHCLDMKKYGGPGLRKQSCKNRKCIIPKVVLLNQSKDEEFMDEKGNFVYPDYYDGADVLDGVELYHLTGGLDGRTSMISVAQECEIFIDRRLVFTCDFCVARFSSKGLLDLHERVEHLPAGATNPIDALEKEASRMFLHPIHQHCFVNAQLREKKQTQRTCPRAYVKLEGRDFQYFMMESYVVLGRLSSWWLNFYQNLGLTAAAGLGGGGVDCHVGSDAAIASKHALIAWDSSRKSFTIECLSDRAPISVNGREVDFESAPVALESRNLVQIGSCTFYFLLPKVSSDNDEQWRARRQDQQETLPRSELQAWLHATMRKRRASASADKLDHGREAAAIKKRCQERLAASA